MRILILLFMVLVLSGFSSEKYQEQKAKGGTFKFDGVLVSLPKVAPKQEVKKQINDLDLFFNNLKLMVLDYKPEVKNRTYFTED